MFVSSAGNVGIGTSSPWETVSIPFNEKLSFGSSAYPFSISRSSAGTLITTFEDGYNDVNTRIDFKMRGGAVTPLSLLGSGNVGIGTGSPVSELDVAGTTPTLTIKDTQNKSWTSADTTLGELAFRTSDTSGIGAHNVSFVRAVNEVASGSTPSGALSFGVAASNANASEAMRIDSAGKVGIGITPATAMHVYQATGNTALRVESAAANSQAQINFKNDARRYNVGINSSDNLVFEDDTAASTRMTIDTSGNLLVGKTTTGVAGAGTVIRAGGELFVTRAGDVMNLNRLTSDGEIAYFRKDGAAVGSIGSNSGDSLFIQSSSTSGCGLLFHNSAFLMPARSGTVIDNVINLGRSDQRFKDLYLSGTANIGTYLRFGGASNYYVHSDNANYLRFGTAGSERLRIDSAGNLLVGTTSFANPASGFTVSASAETKIQINHVNGTGSGVAFATFRYNQSQIGSITQNGTSATLYNTTSDERVKENIADADDAGSKIDAIQVRQYDWKADGSHQDYGMIAQELQTVAPEAVSVPENPEDMMGVDYSKLVPMLIKEIQSLRNRVAQLEE